MAALENEADPGLLMNAPLQADLPCAHPHDPKMNNVKTVLRVLNSLIPPSTGIYAVHAIRKLDRNQCGYQVTLHCTKCTGVVPAHDERNAERWCKDGNRLFQKLQPYQPRGCKFVRTGFGRSGERLSQVGHPAYAIVTEQDALLAEADGIILERNDPLPNLFLKKVLPVREAVCWQLLVRTYCTGCIWN